MYRMERTGKEMGEKEYRNTVQRKWFAFNDISYFSSICRKMCTIYSGKSMGLDENPQIVSCNVLSRILDCTRSDRAVRISSCNSQLGIGDGE